MTKFFSLLTTLSALLFCLPSCITPPPKKLSPPQPPSLVKTGKFWWGTSSSSFQNEDRGEKPGSPAYFRTDWDEFADEGLIPPRGDDATFSWSLFDKDVAALKALGVNHYRFGIEWGRVEPRPGEFNLRALNQYATMAKKLRAAGIEPVVTLWHFTFPDWLYDKNDKAHSGFLHPDAEKSWDRFVEKTTAHLAPHVRIFVPQNEPNGALYIGYFGGHWPPGLLVTPGSLKKATAASVRMFQSASRIIKTQRKDALVMGIYSLPHWRKNSIQDATSAIYNMMQHQNFDHLDRCADSMDIIGVNYYYSQDASVLRFIRRPHGEVTSNYTQNGWEIDPEGLHSVLLQVHRRYGKPMVISENGIGTQSEQKKTRYFREHVNQMLRAMNDGADIRGYFPWTLVDNYEWAEGYGANFGLTHLNPKTKTLVIEPSGYWFRNYIRSNPNP